MPRTPLKSALLASAILSTAILAQAQAATTAPAEDTTVVLVHGAFADGSSWDKVIPLLQAKGLKVVAVQNPLTSLADDVAAAQRVIDAQTGRVILVGHSWGGTVITQAGTSDKVKALVYVAAFAPSEGEASGDLGKDYPTPPGIATLKADASGFLYLPEESVRLNFAQDLPAATTRLMAVTQGPIQAKAFADKTTVAAWKNKPNYYIVSAKDRMISPELEQAFAKKLHAVTTVLQTSHVAMLSQPKQVAEVILAAAAQR
ncbi:MULTISPECIES: alpha/beta fold hydrolase [unclassified Janthinobacterium]|uniref:alpha/beta fold hydrolase n=1 Tax=unclassified Janthinobacterium TaxID=2610881 RepID=UPI00161E4303|nr:MULTISPECIES: alpha/beta hydrolase [unclassified Janthinobacterium]MBB5367936.1 pimeloyl-ACP methyl ester carboxylesterase [Janthinobacterium sp. K2C7]MBB5379586.1 pimeloyl-ACP methyl ester carboxylesterase [Janthinobacterium sp. K2Li3]MBB5386318.1 pimeloyl-ACP methyl ester carboxylesterase [Janthinobacterium sp. K2E3]